MERKLRINGHSHLLPYPEEIPQFMKDKEIFWVDDERKFMLQKNWKRPVTDSSFFLNEKLEWMDRNKIDHAVTGVSPPSLDPGDVETVRGDGHQSTAMCR